MRERWPGEFRMFGRSGLLRCELQALDGQMRVFSPSDYPAVGGAGLHVRANELSEDLSKRVESLLFTP